MSAVTVTLSFVTGLVIFLYGIENFGREILSLGGPKFQFWLERFTRNRLSATGLGMVVTALIQSSTATTVITVSLVSGGLITFASSLGVIFGANIGTTITAQLVAFKMTQYATYIVVSGFFIGIFGRQYRFLGKGIFYFGLVFFGLELVSQALDPVKDEELMLDLIASLDNVLLAFLVGIAITAVVQSSSVTTGLIVVLAVNHLISVQQGIPILLGTNIGTTVTTMIAASRLSLHARRGAVAHLLFNVIGAVVALPLVVPFAAMVRAIGGTEAQQIANAHTIFNVVATLVFLAFLEPFRRLVERLVRGEEEEIILKPKYLGATLAAESRQVFEDIEKELGYAKAVTATLFSRTLDFQAIRTPRLANEIEKYESLTDILDERIEAALLELSRQRLTDEEAQQVVALVRLSNGLEQISDIARDQAKLIQEERNPSPADLLYRFRNLMPIHEKLVEVMRLYAHEPASPQKTRSLRRHLSAFEPMFEHNYASHLDQLKQETPYNSAFFVEFVSLIEAAVSKLRDILVIETEYVQHARRTEPLPEAPPAKAPEPTATS
jgi:phosphate:Na+ symporter